MKTESRIKSIKKNVLSPTLFLEHIEFLAAYHLGVNAELSQLD